MEAKYQRTGLLHGVFRNPLLSCILKFLHLLEVFRTVRLVCSQWAATKFDFAHLELRQLNHMDPGIFIKCINCSAVLTAEVYVHAGVIAPLLTSATHLYLDNVHEVDLSSCKSLRWLWVIDDNKPRALPESLRGVSMSHILAFDVVRTLPELTVLGGITDSFEKDTWDYLESLHVTRATVRTDHSDYINAKKFPKNWVFEVVIDSTSSTAFLDEPRYSLECLTSIDLNVDHVSVHQFRTLAGFPHLTRAKFSGSFQICMDAEACEVWPKLEKVELEVGVSLCILSNFVNAQRLRTIAFHGYCGDWFDEDLPKLPQVTQVLCSQCDIEFIENINFLNMNSISITYFDARFNHNSYCIKLLDHLLLPGGMQVNLDLCFWTADCAQNFLTHNASAAEVCFDFPYKAQGHLDVPCDMVVVLPQRHEHGLTCKGKVRWVEDYELYSRRAVRNFDEDAYLDFKKSIKQVYGIPC